MKKENKSNSSNVHISCMSKGGVGKTTFTSPLSTMLYLNNPEKQINIFELDDFNEAEKVKSSFINHQTLKLKSTEIIIDEVQYHSLSDSSLINIIDVGGGVSTKVVLGKLKEIELKNSNYYLPLCTDIDQIKNIKDTINLILEFDKYANINLVLNKCKKMDKDVIEEQFLNIYGDPDFDVPCQLDNLKVNNIFFVPETNVFTLLKSHYKVALLDSYLSSKDLIENIVQYHQEWRQKGGVELFKANNKRLRFAKMVIKLIDDLEPIRKALL
ncbi:hypothetical protein N5T98_02220 [Aliarcobacter cryaerophilus]|uniref:hypothetical protein n=1 Tax=Aliarcobacter cryaerophilus TaxID=28198 RepID=UPI0021B522B5|nr:hypothetical protein [Aliarcobacter cryaerophilus]MCT7484922.1 hypothetical protein [Aliarcobacter cryaerophilus]MCT7489908.1 hypothetical protein [Aliarcobacter cryaerophilus]